MYDLTGLRIHDAIEFHNFHFSTIGIANWVYKTTEKYKDCTEISVLSARRLLKKSAIEYEKLFNMKVHIQRRKEEALEAISFFELQNELIVSQDAKDLITLPFVKLLETMEPVCQACNEIHDMFEAIVGPSKKEKPEEEANDIMTNLFSKVFTTGYAVK
jgi:hypothetical protein